MSTKALIVVMGARIDGYRKIPGARVAEAENELTWEGISSDLKERDHTKVDLIISEVIPESSPQLGKCSRAPRSRCAMYTSSR